MIHDSENDRPETAVILVYGAEGFLCFPIETQPAFVYNTVFSNITRSTIEGWPYEA